MIQPTSGLHLALDPRIPADLQAFAFRVPRNIEASRIEWILNGELAGQTGKGEHQFLWPIVRGTHAVLARVWLKDESEPVETPQVAFTVK